MGIQNMKRLSYVLLGLLVFLAILIGSVLLYFNDARLKRIILPMASSSLGMEVQAESMSLSLIRSFPRAGITVKGLQIGHPDSSFLQDLESLEMRLKILPLLSNTLDVDRLIMRSAAIHYEVYPDSTTNLDPLFQAFSDTTAADTSAEAWDVELRRIVLESSTIRYLDAPKQAQLSIDQFDLNASLKFTEVLESDFDANITGLNIKQRDTLIISNLSFGLNQSSSIDFDAERIELNEGHLRIGDFKLGLSGTIEHWSDPVVLDVAIASSSDDFSELFKLLPESIRQHFATYDTKGAFEIEAKVKGKLGAVDIPRFEAKVALKEGYLKDRNLPTAIEDINLEFKANNDLVELASLSARAGSNRITAKGKLLSPLDQKKAELQLHVSAKVDLQTVNDFYDLRQHDIETLKGQLQAEIDVDGLLEQLDQGLFKADLNIIDGYLKYASVARPIEEVNIRLAGDREQLRIADFRARASENRVQLSGLVTQPLTLDKTRFDLSYDLVSNLATLKDFYPMSEDTFALKGSFSSKGSVKGLYKEMEKATVSGSIALQNGYLKYTQLGKKPIEHIQFKGSLNGQALQFDTASFQAGSNRVEAKGSIRAILSEKPIADLTVKTNFNLAEAGDFVPLDPALKQIKGRAQSDLTLRGPLTEFQNMYFVGSLVLDKVGIVHDSLPKPITDLNAKLQFSQQALNLEQMVFKMGASDLDIKGSTRGYMAVFSEDGAEPAQLTGSLSSRFLHLDELYPMSGEEEEVLLVLPNMNARLNASIDSMIVFASPVTQLKTTLEMSPKQVIMRNGSFRLFGGTIRGAFVFDVLNPRSSLLDFAGELIDVRIETFFKEFPVFGSKTRIHEYLSGGINFTTDYKTNLDSYLNPQTSTTDASGSFGMSAVRIRNHPIQVALADFLKLPEIKDIGLNEWQTNFVIGKSMLNIRDLKMKARDIGFELDGTENMVNDQITYQAKIFLPKRLSSAITQVLPAEASRALVQPDSTFLLPLSIRGTYTKPQIGLDQEVLRGMVDAYVKRQASSLEEAARERLQQLLRRKQQ
jgi:uncharacterized protein involved in outer membrane biogenesis